MTTGISRSVPASIGEADKVQAWPWDRVKVNDKRLARDEPPANDITETRPSLRDVELDKAAKRTELLRARMSPPGALGLPPKLDAARLKWGIPDGAFKARAIFDRIHVFPIDLYDNKDTIGDSAIIRPEIAKKKDEQNGHRGVLISMGLSAADHCVSHGTELGNIVRTIRNAPHAQECERLEGFSVFYLVMRDGDLTGDETLEEEVRSGVARITDEGGEHSYCYQLSGRKKKVPLVRDGW